MRMTQRLVSRRAAAISRVVLAVITMLALGACAVHLIAPHDEYVEKTITTFNEQFETFVEAMNRKAGTDRGTQQANVEFYEEWNGRLKALSARTLAWNPGASCPGNEAFRRLLVGAAAPIAGFLDRGAPGGETPQGDCTARLAKYVELQFKDFEAFHRAQGGIGIPAGANAPVELMRVATRALLQVELAKKSGK